MPNLKLPGYVCYGSKNWARHVGGFGSVFQNQEILQVGREMCRFRDVEEMAVYAPGHKKDLDVYETFRFNGTKI